MNWFNDLPPVYLHRQYVDFRKAVNGLCTIVESELLMNPYDESLYVFCNRGRDKPAIPAVFRKSIVTRVLEGNRIIFSKVTQCPRTYPNRPPLFRAD